MDKEVLRAKELDREFARDWELARDREEGWARVARPGPGPELQLSGPV